MKKVSRESRAKLKVAVEDNAEIRHESVSSTNLKDKTLLSDIIDSEIKHKNGDSECNFCNIAKGKTEAYVVFEDLLSIAFLDKRPLFKGHTILIPKRHYSNLYEVPKDILSTLFQNASIISMGIETAIGAEGTFIAVNNKVSQSVPHFHIHIVPRRHGDGLKGFFWPRQNYESAEEEEKIKETIAIAIAALLEGN